MIRLVAVCLFAACVCPLSTNIARAADDLSKQLLKQAPEILSVLKEKGYRNVGVLKFRVKKGDEAPTDRAGVLNARLAEKLELALILANKVQDPIGIIRNANKTAATIDGATHLTAEGRKSLFNGQYDLAWGEEKVKADAFITGVAFIPADLKAMIIGLAVFDAKSDQLQQLAKFEVKPDVDELLDSGESFVVRGVFDQGSLELSDSERKDKAASEAVQTSLLVKSETSEKSTPSASRTHPLSPTNPDSPVSLEIRYDGKPQPLEFREGAAFVREPNENQKVSLIVRRKGQARPRLGVVLKVNGENTLYRQKQTDAQCAPWVFEPNLSEFEVRGYQLNTGTLQEFKVLSQAESQAKEIDYGEFVGTISISVFKEQTVEPKRSLDLLAEDGEDFAILTRGTFPSKPSRNLSALKFQLADSATRGLIVQGATVQNAIKTTQFTGDTIPIMTASVKYYNPQDLPQ